MLICSNPSVSAASSVRHLPAVQDEYERYMCRESAAQQHAKLACEELELNPPNPPFEKIVLNLKHLKSLGHLGTGVTVPDSVYMAVESDSDLVSEGLRRDGEPHAAAAYSMRRRCQHTHARMAMLSCVW